MFASLPPIYTSYPILKLVPSTEDEQNQIGKRIQFPPDVAHDQHSAHNLLITKPLQNDRTPLVHAPAVPSNEYHHTVFMPGSRSLQRVRAPKRHVKAACSSLTCQRQPKVADSTRRHGCRFGLNAAATDRLLLRMLACGWLPNIHPSHCNIASHVFLIHIDSYLLPV
ncbi:hypothetical protein DM02DRAFT_607814 [Periconia macrospinosa]|uniref:Uncharacterized protein n=1 Tax=Periconia macrospinosa TaxID=97972 RepID=A0A2V1ECX2_9PLEO|nr:hypothetical protein DM02DRAFT_607814 [Periconia macrospinosa]